MSLYGALYTGVSGLNAQGQKIGTISDNIANVNTVGYKETKTAFETLVVSAAGKTASYSPGGVRSNTVQNVTKQGLLTTTSSSTDLAISGGGFFVVSARPDGAGQALYTRAGSFKQDSVGNFQNANGFYLKGWPLDRDGRLPGEVGNLNSISSANLESLKVVNVDSAAGVALPTSNIKLGVNLNAGEKIYQGPKGTVGMDLGSANNYGINASQIIVPDEAYTPFVPGTPSFGLATTNNISRGDKFTAQLGNGLTYDYEYGGFSIGRAIDSSLATNIGDNGLSQMPITLAGAEMETDGIGASTVTIDLASLGFTPAEVTALTSSLQIGDKFQLTGMGGFGGISAANLNKVQSIAAINAGTGTITFDTGQAATSAGTANAAGGGFSFRIFQGNILDATSASGSFLGTTGTTGYTSSALKFTITTPSSGTHTFSYVTGSPSALLGQFTNLTNLSEAINQTQGLTARVVNGRLTVSSTDASEEVKFANLDDAGNASADGIDWVGELGLKNVDVGTRRFNSMSSLAKVMNGDTGLKATIDNPLGEATMALAGTDPLSTVRFTDYVTKPLAFGAGDVTAPGAAAGAAQTVNIHIVGHSFSTGDTITLSGLTATNGFTLAELNKSYTVTVVDADNVSIQLTAAGATTALTSTDGAWSKGNKGSILAELGLVKTLNGGTYVRGDTGVLGPQYDASAASGANMASGDITAQFSRTTRVYDSLGTGHDVRFSYLKIDDNKWAVEVHAVNVDEINSTLVDGQLAVGFIEFNGDGTLRTVSSSLSSDVTVNWKNGSAPSKISFDLGTAGQPAGTPGATQIGLTDGLSQFDSAYNVNFITQNGAPVGELVGVAIDGDGFVIASYSNGQTQKLYKLPIADFANPNGLKSETGNVYSQTNDSGEVNLREAGTNGTGTVVASSLEQSNVDLATELTDMIVAQRAYQANTKVIKTSDELLEQLNQL